MKRLFLGAFVLFDLLIAGWAPSLALASTPTTSYDGSGISGKITLHGRMPLSRFVYVDNQDKILSVVGNTSQNIAPQVVRASNYKIIGLSSYINDQYQAILAANGEQLSPGLTYYPASQPAVIASVGVPSITSLKLAI